MDGAELDREKNKNKYFVKSSGKHDEILFTEANNFKPRQMFSISQEAWQRIFRGRIIKWQK